MKYFQLNHLHLNFLVAQFEKQSMIQKLIEYYSVCIPKLFYQCSLFQTTRKLAIIKFSIDFSLYVGLASTVSL